jgi:dTDP-4-dehydrorhamnose 3,5-epimerase
MLFEGCKILDLYKFTDLRGKFIRIADSKNLPSDFHLNQVSISHNPKKFTLRGLHFQRSLSDEYKLISVLSGTIFDVLVDLRNDSETYLKHSTFVFSEKDYKALLIPPGIAHGFLTLKKNTTVHYSMSCEFDPSNYSGLLWNDDRLKISWPHKPKILSDQDQKWKPL